jgi:sensor histidine kinase regulating citrate/malate metabolism
VLPYVHRILAVRFRGQRFGRILWNIDPAVKELHVSVPRTEAIHVLMNVLANGIESMIASGEEEPEYDILPGPTGEGFVEIGLEDRGSGLSPARFEELTAADIVPGAADSPRTGLGLRLIHRLVERAGGSLTVAPRTSGQAGSLFKLRWPSTSGAPASR